jgi:hypothetical protein
MDRRTRTGTGILLGTLRHTALLFAMSAVALWPTKARAESGVPYDTCAPTSVHLPATLPANVPGLPMSADVEPIDVMLLGADGTTVEITVTRSPWDGAFIASPKTPLVVGTVYTLSWGDCAGGGSATFTATAAAPLPTDVGEVSAEAATDSSDDGHCDALGRPLLIRAHAIRFTPSEALLPFLGVSKIDLTVDGSLYATSVESPPEGVGLGSALYNCPTASPSQSIAARVRIAGNAPVSTPSLDVDSECPAAGSRTCKPAEPSDAAVPGDDASTPGADNQTIRATCAYGIGGSAGGWLAIALGLLLARGRRAAA